MPKIKISRTQSPDVEMDEVAIYPDGDSSKPRIGVLKFNKGTSKFELDEGILPYRSMNE